MANFPQYTYQPQPLGYQQIQPMQQMYQPQYPTQQVQQEAQLYCRMVASADEAKGVPVDFSGRPMIFPHLSAGRIYVKAFDSGTGGAVFREFRLVEEPKQDTVNAVVYAPMSEVEALKDCVRKLEKKLAVLAPQEVINDEH